MCLCRVLSFIPRTKPNTCRGASTRVAEANEDVSSTATLLVSTHADFVLQQAAGKGPMTDLKMRHVGGISAFRYQSVTSAITFDLETKR